MGLKLSFWKSKAKSIGYIKVNCCEDVLHCYSMTICTVFAAFHHCHLDQHFLYYYGNPSLKICSNALHVNMAVFGFQQQHQQTAENYASSDWFVSYKMKAVWHTTEGTQPPKSFHRAELRIENNSHKLVSEENRGFIETFHTEEVELKEQSKQGILWLHWRYTDIKLLPLFTLWYMWLERPGEFSFTCNWNMYLPSLFWKCVSMIASPLTLL